MRTREKGEKQRKGQGEGQQEVIEVLSPENVNRADDEEKEMRGNNLQDDHIGDTGLVAIEADLKLLLFEPSGRIRLAVKQPSSSGNIGLVLDTTRLDCHLLCLSPGDFDSEKYTITGKLGIVLEVVER